MVGRGVRMLHGGKDLTYEHTVIPAESLSFLLRKKGSWVKQMFSSSSLWARNQRKLSRPTLVYQDVYCREQLPPKALTVVTHSDRCLQGSVWSRGTQGVGGHCGKTSHTCWLNLFRCRSLMAHLPETVPFSNPHKGKECSGSYPGVYYPTLVAMWETRLSVAKV